MRKSVHAFLRERGIKADGAITPDLLAAVEVALKDGAASQQVSDRMAGQRGDPAGFGTGFFVSRAGHLLTNHHVVEQCSRVTVALPNRIAPVRVLASSEENDLALLALVEGSAPAVASFRPPGSVALGEEVLVAGFPLPDLLGGGLVVTTGVINALTGIEANPRDIQLSAPIQDGSSGGPVLDRDGRVVGVVWGRVAPSDREKPDASPAQLVNFAIKAPLARGFLEASGVPFEVAAESGSPGRKDWSMLAKQAGEYVVRVECW